MILSLVKAKGCWHQRYRNRMKFTEVPYKHFCLTLDLFTLTPLSWKNIARGRLVAARDHKISFKFPHFYKALRLQFDVSSSQLHFIYRTVTIYYSSLYQYSDISWSPYRLKRLSYLRLLFTPDAFTSTIRNAGFAQKSQIRSWPG